jgi:hypothetical protein
MFKFLKRKRHDPEAIANVVLASASEPGIFSAFWKEFAVSEDQHPRVLFSVVIFAYCWSRGWASGTKDIRVWEAYDRAAGIIALRFKDATKLVRVSDYVVSALEISEFYFELFKHFHLQIPVNADPTCDPENIVRAHDDAVRSYQIRFEILTRTVMQMRNERMIRELSGFATSNLEVPNALMLLSTTLYEQISGITPMDLSRDPNLMTEEFSISQPRRLRVIQPLLERLAIGLESL